MMAIHFRHETESWAFTYCGGQLLTGQVPERDRITGEPGNVTCPGCLLLMADWPDEPHVCDRDGHAGKADSALCRL